MQEIGTCKIEVVVFFLFFFLLFSGGFGDSDWMSQGLDFDGGQSDEVEKERKRDARLTS